MMSENINYQGYRLSQHRIENEVEVSQSLFVYREDHHVSQTQYDLL